MMEMTSTHAKGIVGHLTCAFGTRVVGRDKVIMRIAGRIARRRTGMTLDTFNERFVTTLVNRIFAPFRVGDAGNAAWPPATQVRILIHEHQHVIIRRRMRLVRYTREYATPRGRAIIEAECYAAEFAWRWARTRWMPSPASRVSNLAAYGCSKEDIDEAEKMLSRFSWMIRGEPPTTDTSEMTDPKVIIDAMTNDAALALEHHRLFPNGLRPQSTQAAIDWCLKNAPGLLHHEERPCPTQEGGR